MNHPLLPNEELVMTSDDGKTILTNMRLILTGDSWSSSSFLEEISSVEVTKHADWGLFSVGTLLLYVLEALFLYAVDYDFFLFILVATPLLVLLLWWVFHRSRITVIVNNGRKVNIMVNQKAFDQIPAFTWRIQNERTNRLANLAPRP